jgi:predicted nucleic acid-binding protein
MKYKFFIDSNIWIYIFCADDCEKEKTASEFIRKTVPDNIIVISYQVINEVTGVLKKKDFSEEDIKHIIEILFSICAVHDYSKDSIMLASEIREKYKFSFWDSHITAAALSAECDFLITEDMQNNQEMYGKLKIKNPFSPKRG